MVWQCNGAVSYTSRGLLPLVVVEEVVVVVVVMIALDLFHVFLTETNQLERSLYECDLFKKLTDRQSTRLPTDVTQPATSSPSEPY